jgi:TM2 domain-containing membrane protein YozV
MNKQKNSIITLWLVFIFLSTSCFSSDSDSLFAFADQLYQQKQFTDAGIAYERIAFENTGKEELVCVALLKKSDCLKAMQKYEPINVVLQRCNLNAINDSLKAQVYFERALSCYLSNNFDQSKKLLLPLLSLNVSPEQDKAAVFLYSLTLNELREWEGSKMNLLQYIKRIPGADEAKKTSLSNEINEIYSKNNIPRLKRLKKARLLSAIIPGAGQAYLGKAGRGALNLTLVALSGVFAYANIINELYIAAASGVYLTEAFYVGNINQNKRICRIRNDKVTDKANNQLRAKLADINAQIK